MLDVLMTILYIILFLVCLSILIIVHEFGHLTAAKVFNVYCLEFSCGMGPLIWKHKKKNGETQFSLRAIPFGGYVSMYGEGVELPEGVTVDESRSLHNIKKWKQAIILVAGVSMNAILALIIFFVGNIACEQKSFVYSNEIAVVEGSTCDIAGLKDTDLLAYDKDGWSDKTSVMLRDNAVITFTSGETVESKAVLKPVASFNEPIYSYTFYGIADGKVNTAISYTENIQSVSLNLKTKNNADDSDSLDFTDHPIVIDFVDGQMKDNGLRVYIQAKRYSFGGAVKQTFVDFGNSATAIADGLKSLITGEVGLDQMSGIVGIGFEAKGILDDLGPAKFIYLWGLISVNLAIINLLPFPGLDGWQLLVVIIEGITRKKIPDKVKAIFSFIGLALLLTLMVVILFKDVFVYIIQGLVMGMRL